MQTHHRQYAITSINNICHNLKMLLRLNWNFKQVSESKLIISVLRRVRSYQISTMKMLLFYITTSYTIIILFMFKTDSNWKFWFLLFRAKHCLHFGISGSSVSKQLFLTNVEISRLRRVFLTLAKKKVVPKDFWLVIFQISPRLVLETSHSLKRHALGK